MQHLSASVYTFKPLIEDNYRYINNTFYLWELSKQPLGSYSLLRLRRFDTSLNISTLRQFFRVKKISILTRGLFYSKRAVTDNPIISGNGTILPIPGGLLNKMSHSNLFLSS